MEPVNVIIVSFKVWVKQRIFNHTKLSRKIEQKMFNFPAQLFAVRNAIFQPNFKRNDYYVYWFHWFMSFYSVNGQALYISGGGSTSNTIGTVTWVYPQTISWFATNEANSQLNASQNSYTWYCIG